MIVFPFKEKITSDYGTREKTEERHFLKTYKREMVKMFKKDSRGH